MSLVSPVSIFLTTILSYRVGLSRLVNYGGKSVMNMSIEIDYENTPAGVQSLIQRVSTLQKPLHALAHHDDIDKYNPRVRLRIHLIMASSLVNGACKNHPFHHRLRDAIGVLLWSSSMALSAAQDCIPDRGPLYKEIEDLLHEITALTMKLDCKS